MTRKEFIERLAEVSSLACALRSKLEEMSDECRQEWCENEDGDEIDWYEKEQYFLSLANAASEIEGELDQMK